MADVATKLAELVAPAAWRRRTEPGVYGRPAAADPSTDAATAATAAAYLPAAQ